MPYLSEHKLKELIKVTRGASLSGQYFAEEGDLIRLTLGNFDYANGGFKENSSKDNIYYSGSVSENFIMNEGDIITPLTEQTPGLLGSTARIPESGKYIQSQDVGLVTCDEEKIDKDFCYYLLPSEIVKKQLAAGAQQTKIRHTSPDKIEACTVFIPKPKEQKKIGRLLSAIDKIIDLKRKEIDRLKLMAKQIYDYWFVQFDFPNEEGMPYKSSGGKMVWDETIKREIPEGWEVLNVFDAANVLYGYPFSTDCFVEEPTNKPVVRIRDILDNTSSAYTTENVDEVYRLNEGDLVIGMDGNFHMNYWHDNRCYLNQRCVRIRDIPEIPLSPMQLFFNIKPILDHKQRLIQGSTVGHLLDSDIKEFWIICPPQEKRKYIKSQFDNILKSITRNKQEVVLLDNLRSYLLPILMNGQVTIKD